MTTSLNDRESSTVVQKWDNSVTLVEAADGESALTLLRSAYFDVLITDIKMPMMDGVELIQRVRDFNQSIRVIIISGYDDFNYARRLLQYRVDDYILKPVNVPEFMAVLNKIEPQASPTESSVQVPVIQAVIDIIEHDFMKDLTLEDVAQRVFLSPSYLSNLFKKQTGSSFTKYLNNVRMSKAKELLAGSYMKVTDIASFIGIDNVSYFNRLFKASCGVTPMAYRQQEAKVR